MTEPISTELMNNTEPKADNDNDNKTKTNTKTKTTKGDQKKAPNKEELERHIRRKMWVDRIVMILLVSALIVYFIVLVISMVSSGNSTVVEKEDTETKMNIPVSYVEFLTDSASTTLDCTLELYTDGDLKVSGSYVGKVFTQATLADGWEYVNLIDYAADSEEYNYTGLIITPPEDSTIPIRRNVENHIDIECVGDNTTVYVNLYYSGQYDQYEEGSEETDAISYDSYESKLGFDTNLDLIWYTISDELEFAQAPQELDGIEGAYDYYEMELSGVYPLSAAQGDGASKTSFAGYRKHTQYVYQDATTIFDVIAAIGGMYTSLASIIAWFTVKFLWGYDFRVYKWTGYAPYAPKDKKEKEEGEEEDGGDD